MLYYLLVAPWYHFTMLLGNFLGFLLHILFMVTAQVWRYLWGGVVSLCYVHGWHPWVRALFPLRYAMGLVIILGRLLGCILVLMGLAARYHYVKFSGGILGFELYNIMVYVTCLSASMGSCLSSSSWSTPSGFMLWVIAPP